MERVLFTSVEIDDAISKIATTFNNQYNESNEDRVVMVPILQGAIPFFSRLAQQLEFDPYVEYAGLSSYDGEMQKEFNFYKIPNLEIIRDRTVWLFDDLADSGNSLQFLRQMLMQFGAREVKTCVLVCKHHCALQVDIAGLQMADEWIWGYGMDAPNGRGRLLKSIYCKSEN